MNKKIVSILSVAFVLLLWEVISANNLVNKTLFPPPSDALQSLINMFSNGILLSDIKSSIWRLTIGLIIGSLAGMVVGVVTGRIKIMSFILTPLVNILRPLPPVALIPLIIVWFGIDDISKIFSIAYGVFFPVWINVHIGSQNISLKYLWTAKIFIQRRFEIFTKVILPATLPYIVAGIRSGIAMGFIMVFVSELAGASSGIGYRISVSHLAYKIDDMIAALFVLGFLGYIYDYLFVRIIRKVFPWINLSSG